MNTPAICNIESDIYYQKEYSNLYLQNSDEELFEYLYKEDDSYVQFRSIKRLISKVSGTSIQETLYDLETPYGYGGPVSNSFDKDFLKRAFTSYKHHCKEQNIVCEFIRFHPFNSLANCSYLFDMHFPERQVVIVDLQVSDEERRKQYSKTTRNIVKKAIKRLSVEVDTSNVDDFMSVYYQTMTKNGADEFFFFQKEYFSALMALNGVHLISAKLDDELAAIGYFMCWGELAHYHLSANNQNMSKENGNYLLLDAAFDLAKEKGCNYMMLGGGRTSSPDDSLFKFKSKFSSITMPFYISGLDFLPEKRAELNSLWVEQNQDKPAPKLFQLYRA
ncbi:putative uncharacterized protein [Aliivibrio wodanis]|uniref:BioF2-like acetyltransferase domain-containing protein n=1 Tax=Aliivibrio wodanis TaxID=80852 RepID=A0A090IID7_9GAMM|nr:putative uncharacterized protein [Aliivibrio wodanis]